MVYMKSVQISLDSIEKVKSFVHAVNRLDGEFDLVSGRYIVDAKSIMGIFSLDLSRPIELQIHPSSGTDQIMKALKPYLA